MSDEEPAYLSAPDYLTEDERQDFNTIFQSLNGNQARFVAIYARKGLQDRTQAAIEAGYAPKAANVQACMVSKRPHVARLIEYLSGDYRSLAELQAIEAQNETVSHIESLAKLGQEAPELTRNDASKWLAMIINLSAYEMVKLRQAIEEADDEFLKRVKWLDGFDGRGNPKIPSKLQALSALVDLHGWATPTKTALDEVSATLTGVLDVIGRQGGDVSQLRSADSEADERRTDGDV